MLLNRYSRASASTALGYTMPLVMPPFMTRSQYLSATVLPPSMPSAAWMPVWRSGFSGPENTTAVRAGICGVQQMAGLQA